MAVKVIALAGMEPVTRGLVRGWLGNKNYGLAHPGLTRLYSRHVRLSTAQEKAERLQARGNQVIMIEK